MESQPPRVAIHAGATDGLYRWHLLDEHSVTVLSAPRGYVSRKRAEDDLMNLGALLLHLGYVPGTEEIVDHLREIQIRGAREIEEANKELRDAKESRYKSRLK